MTEVLRMCTTASPFPIQRKSCIVGRLTLTPPHAHSRVQLDPKHAILKALTQHLFQRRRHRLHRDDEVTKVVSRGDGKFSESGHSAIRVNFLDIPL